MNQCRVCMQTYFSSSVHCVGLLCVVVYLGTNEITNQPIWWRSKRRKLNHSLLKFIYVSKKNQSEPRQWKEKGKNIYKRLERDEVKWRKNCSNFNIWTCD